SGAAAAAHGVPAAGPPGAVIIATNHAVDAACIARSVLARVPAMHFIAGDGLDLTDRNFRAAAGPAAHAFFTVAFWHPGVATTALVAWRIGTTARTLRRQSVAVLDQYATLRLRSDALDQAIADTRTLLTASDPAVERIRAVRTRLDSIGLSRSPGTAPGIPTE